MRSSRGSLELLNIELVPFFYSIDNPWARVKFFNMIKFFQLIAEGKDGFSFGKSWRYSEDSLVALLPILRVAPKKKRGYVLLSEAKNVKIEDTGHINKLLIENNEKSPVYIRMGEMFTGGSQERMATRSYIVMPKEKIKIDVRCVHASKGINTGVTMTSSGIAPSSFDSHLCSAGFKMRSIEQREVWKNVDNVAQSFCCASREMYNAGDDTADSPININDERTTGSRLGQVDITPGIDSTTIPIYSFTDDLMGNIDKFSDQIKNILQKVPYFENQVGVSLVDLHGISAVECFDLKDSWKKFKDEIIKKEGDKISKQQKNSPFQYKEERAKESLKIVLKADYEEKTLFKSKDWRIIGLKNENYTGEIVELKDKPIHLLLVRNK